MRLLNVVNLTLLAILVVLQYPLWFAEGSWWTVFQLRQELKWQQVENTRLNERNARLAAEVQDLRSGVGAIEERARMELGMVKRGEVFVQVVK